MENLQELAEKLYTMCEDMDYQDYAEEKETEINKIAMQLRMLKEFGCHELLKALEIITEVEVTEMYDADVDVEAMEHNDRMRNESDKHREYMEMKSMYEEGLLEF